MKGHLQCRDTFSMSLGCPHIAGTTVASYYRPPNDKDTAIANLEESISKVRNKSKEGIIIIGGDFNLPNINWTTLSHTTGKNNQKQCKALLNLINNYHLEQLTRFPTRKNNTLDLCLTSHPSLISNIQPKPGISDHEAVEIILNTKFEINKKTS